jgi:hypothetical protein
VLPGPGPGWLPTRRIQCDGTGESGAGRNSSKVTAVAFCALACRLLVAAVPALAVAGCLPEEGAGYVEVKVFPRFPLPLYLNTEKIESMKEGVAVLRQAVGKSKLQIERHGQLFPLCEFDVRKNRVTTVTVSSLDRGPRCDVQR